MRTIMAVGDCPWRAFWPFPRCLANNSGRHRFMMIPGPVLITGCESIWALVKETPGLVRLVNNWPWQLFMATVTPLNS